MSPKPARERVLVTGGAGYLGCVLTEQLLEAGYRVTVLDSLAHGEMQLLHLVRNDRLTFVRGDSRNESLMRSLVKDKDVLIPLAAVVGAKACDEHPVTAQTTNLDAVRMLLKRRSGDQIVLYPNTNSGYGATSGELHCTEESPLEPISIYGRTKVDAEKDVLSSGHGLSFRFATLFGISPRMRLDLLVNDFTFRALRDRFLVIFERHFKRNYLHVRDGAAVFLHAIEHFDAMKGRPYNVGLSDANLSKEELAAEIKKRVPELYVHFAEIGSDPDKRNYIVSNERIEKSGFKPKRSLGDGIDELLRGYKMLPVFPYHNA